MQLLKDRIRKDGKIKEGNVLKVDSFLNHQMDVKLFQEIGKEFKRRLRDHKDSYHRSFRYRHRMCCSRSI